MTTPVDGSFDLSSLGLGVPAATKKTDLELARYAENAVSYQSSLLFASNRISTLRMALTGSRT